ncbi:multisubunit potassium/proton antiporter PhaG subunit [Aminobacter aminovorans]|jgi:multicomponent K+:H+ antiporter subunit G|uniref:Multiple resistance and pH homeostasis protein G n=1 Tax=Aminobacter aminovorans TaxID=83263 RepID=A0A381IMH2_AMIAI|nr:monovalent cation/H(+) antiporter subunit G [Aminobacter aminovorans]TCS24919.1 multisubunit potassium/proton antiporter PhaG subunit [Aminobacter aminovorans]SUY28679.1 Multiple resistance and pH homeostasis protein G [Aminobacter aminovorans]
MSHIADLPVWAALLVAFFLVLGSGLTLLGAIGLVRFETFYARVHAPTLGTTWGAGAILIASIVCFSVLQSRPVLHEVLITIFVVVTTPVTLMLLARAALYRDRTANEPGIPRDDQIES